MTHLSQDEITALAEGVAPTSGERAHLNRCTRCAARLAQAQRLEESLAMLGRAPHATDLTARILAQLPADAQIAPWRPTWPVAAAAAAAVIATALAFQTALDLRAGGVFDLMAVYSTQPEIVSMYPDAALGALSAVVPWASLLASLLALVAALALAYRAAGSGLNARRVQL